ncbi:serine/threonine-protein kinase [Streptomyces sparsogenes]|uniref:serine/threonine-protein kinase n=1 Tax=Streptomyces sparsogenes TaxID=67365 RepID=UPI00332CFDD6
MSDVRPGEMVGKYRLTKGPVGGGRGVVWFAVEPELGQRVVLKRAGVEDNGQAAYEELVAEARALVKFADHPNVVTLYGVERTGQGRNATFWLVMQHVTGGSLDGSARLPVKSAAHIGAQIANALVALHAKGIVHCDVKPHNVVITEDGVAKLADFGAAYRLDPEATESPRRPICFTPAYAAPELFDGAPEPASDVASLGATVYALVAGGPPPRGPGRTFRTEALGEEFGPLREPLTAMLRTEPGERPSAAEALRALREVAGPVVLLPELRLDEVTRPLTPFGGERGATTTAPRRPSLVPPRPVAWGVAAVVVVAALAAALWPRDSSSEDASPPAGGRSSRTAAPSAAPTPGFGFGDARTADPCALLKAGVFQRFGHDARVDSHYGNFNRCDALLSSDDNEIVDVTAEFRDDAPPGATAANTAAKRVAVVPGHAGSGRCARTLVLSGVRNAAVEVTAKLIDEAEAPLCDIADAAARHAATVLGRGVLPRRSPGLPADSLARQDACGLLDARALEVVPGIDARDPDVGFGRWSCDWTSTTGRLEVGLRFDQGFFSPPENGRFTRLSGHDAVVMPGYEGEGTCAVEVFAHAGQGHADGPTERVRLVLGGARAGDRPCERATDLAGSAAAALPGG